MISTPLIYFNANVNAIVNMYLYNTIVPSCAIFRMSRQDEHCCHVDSRKLIENMIIP